MIGMASCISFRGEAFRHDVLISAGDEARRCTALFDVGSWTSNGSPFEISGSLELPREVREVLACSDRLTLKLYENGEPYRMLLDEGSGRFLARRL